MDVIHIWSSLNEGAPFTFTQRGPPLMVDNFIAQTSSGHLNSSINLLISHLSKNMNLDKINFLKWFMINITIFITYHTIGLYKNSISVSTFSIVVSFVGSVQQYLRSSTRFLLLQHESPSSLIQWQNGFASSKLCIALFLYWFSSV